MPETSHGFATARAEARRNGVSGRSPRYTARKGRAKTLSDLNSHDPQAARVVRGFQASLCWDLAPLGFFADQSRTRHENAGRPVTRPSCCEGTR